MKIIERLHTQVDMLNSDFELLKYRNKKLRQEIAELKASKTQLIERNKELNSNVDQVLTLVRNGFNIYE